MPPDPRLAPEEQSTSTAQDGATKSSCRAARASSNTAMTHGTAFAVLPDLTSAFNDPGTANALKVTIDIEKESFTLAGRVERSSPPSDASRAPVRDLGRYDPETDVATRNLGRAACIDVLKPQTFKALPAFYRHCLAVARARVLLLLLDLVFFLSLLLLL